MQVSKISVMICVTALLVGALLTRADDTASQARMREALRQKMATTEVPALAPASSSSMTSSSAFPSTAPVRTSDTEAQTRMREALRQKMAATEMQATAAPTAVNSARPDAFPAVTAARQEDVETQNRLREALRAKMAATAAASQAAQATTTATDARSTSQAVSPVSLSPRVMTTFESQAQTTRPTAVAVTSSSEMSADTSAKGAESQAMQQAANAPANFDPSLPISAEKQEQLNALLMLYKADSITPQEYHEKRAKILSAP